MNYLLLNLAVADIMVALFIAPQFILIHTFKHPGGITGTWLCKLLTGGNMMWTGATASAFSLVVIAFERYYAVQYPYGNKGKLTNEKLKVSRLARFSQKIKQTTVFFEKPPLYNRKVGGGFL